MLRFFHKPRHGNVSQFTGGATPTSYLQPTLAVLFGQRGTNQKIANAAFADTFKTAFTAAVGVGASITLWTPTAGNVVQLQHLTLFVSVSQEYILTVNGVNVQDYFILATTQFVAFSHFPGVFCYPVSSALAIKNNGASVADIHVSAWGTEVLA